MMSIDAVRNNRLSAIDLFCGCGGLSCGVRSAGFNILAGIDLNEKYSITYRRNFPETLYLNKDIQFLAPKELLDLVNLKKGELDLLVGGPPCQGFSKNVPASRRKFDSDNNKLVLRFLDYCEGFYPKAILMENVAEMKNGYGQAYTKAIMERLKNTGYIVFSDVLSSADFGVPQKRNRAFFFAIRKDQYSSYFFPERTHRPWDGDLLCNQYINVWEAIGDLPPLQNGEGYESIKYASPPMNSFQAKMRGQLTSVTNHISRKLSPIQFKRMSSLLPGQAINDLPEEIKPKGGYSGAYGRLTKDMICPTITRWVFHSGSGRWGHPIDIRTLSIREIARIQSFPDNFVFEGSFTDMAGQLGNAVPPLLAEALATSLINNLFARR